MKKVKNIVYLIAVFALAACTNGADKADAYGNFEVDEITISAKAQGELMQFNINEGEAIAAGQVLGYIDTTQLHLQRAELAANLLSTQAQKDNVAAQIQVAKDDLARLKKDQTRIKSMHAQQAATQKQLDDINSAVQIAQKSLQVLQTQYPAIMAQEEAINAKKQLLEQRIKEAVIVNEIDGMVLNKLAQEHELVTPGKGLYVAANLDQMFLKAFVAADHLSEIKLGQEVSVFTDALDGSMTQGTGTISWISSKSEFTPKTIQTKKERANTVYAFKVRVKNDGTYKIGMHGEVRFK